VHVIDEPTAMELHGAPPGLDGGILMGRQKP